MTGADAGDPGTEGSISFERAAECYDRTRVTDPVVLRETIDLLARELGDRGPLLEIGVGTGALALPLAERGLWPVGVDLSLGMLEQLRRKSASPPPVVVADATRLPFAGGAFTGAYARWVLHLIPAWRLAVDELCRVVHRGGPVLVEPGGYRGEWLEIWRRIEEELGPSVSHVGLDLHGRGAEELDAAFAAHGGRLGGVVTIGSPAPAPLGPFLEQSRARSFSWTWRVDEGDLLRAIDEVEVWARARYGPELDGVARDRDGLARLSPVRCRSSSRTPGAAGRNGFRYPRRHP